MSVLPFSGKETARVKNLRLNEEQGNVLPLYICILDSLLSFVLAHTINKYYMPEN